ncbi:MAG TPA: capsule assembly Wzi family protein [Geobacteraceae bacterium]
MSVLLVLACLLPGSVFPGRTWALSSTNIPLDSPVYFYLEKLASFGLISTDYKGIRPLSKAEATRLLLEAEQSLESHPELSGEGLIAPLVEELHRFLTREIHLAQEPETAPNFAIKPLSSFRMRYVYLDGVPRSYERPVHDPGGDGVFGIGSGLRPDNPYPTLAQQHGTEGTPLFENNEGIRYRKGNNYEFRFSGEAYGGRNLSLLLEPAFLYSEEGTRTWGWLNKGYVKLGGGGLELEVGRDANWLGLGYRGNITLTNNARNFDLIKLSSPEPLEFKYLWPLKYSLIFSRFDETATDGKVRQPYFFAAKLSFKPTDNVEFGINLGRQVGGTGVNNSVGDVLRGFVGGTDSDNSNSLAGLELRLRFPFLRNAELYGEFSGEDAASFWPIVESYVAGFYIPRLTASGRDDLRFEYFLGNSILYTNGTFPEGYLYKGMPIGHSQGGASEEFFTRYSHWFSLRNRIALEYYHTERGNLGRVAVSGTAQSVERKNSWRGYWTLPIAQSLDAGFMYGWERIHNLNLVGGVHQTNQLLNVDVRYMY